MSNLDKRRAILSAMTEVMTTLPFDDFRDNVQMCMKAASIAGMTSAAGSGDSLRFAGTAARSFWRYARCVIEMVRLRKHRPGERKCLSITFEK